MAYESETRRQAGILREVARSAQTEQKRMNAIVDSAAQWWKGKGGEAFISAYRSIGNDADSFQRSIDHATQSLNRLPTLIERAERERREEAARKAAKDS